MKIALDYDGTFTRDPALWKIFIASAQSRGHEVYIVTMRYPTEPLAHETSCPVFFTSRNAKLKHMQELGHTIDVWIDDMPHLILNHPLVIWPAGKSE